MIVANRKDAGMKPQAVLGLVVALILGLALVGCGSSSKTSAADQQLQQQADYYAIDQIEKTWHKAASTQNVDLMMTVWAPDATFNIGTRTLSGQAQIRAFFEKAGPFLNRATKKKRRHGAVETCPKSSAEPGRDRKQKP